MKKGALILFCILAFIGLLANFSVARADVRFLAIGRPAAIRIQGTTDSLVVEKAAWKGGKFFGIFHVPLDTLDTGIAMRDRHMKEKYLETGKFPKAELVLEACPLKVGETACDGKLTLHGVTKPVSVKFMGTESAKTIKVAAEFGVKLSDFGITIPTFANITVAEDVQIQVDTETAKP